MARKEWELLFNLSAKQNSSFSSTFKAAQSALVETQGKIQLLNKVQSDISAYQKQQQAVDATRQRLSVLQQQYDNIQKEIQETEGYSSALENKLLSMKMSVKLDLKPMWAGIGLVANDDLSQEDYKYLPLALECIVQQ